ncbi:hypothetical protein AMJ86_03925, partial [bacterium SM23_57]
MTSNNETISIIFWVGDVSPQAKQVLEEWIAKVSPNLKVILAMTSEKWFEPKGSTQNVVVVEAPEWDPQEAWAKTLSLTEGQWVVLANADVPVQSQDIEKQLLALKSDKGEVGIIAQDENGNPAWILANRQALTKRALTGNEPLIPTDQ